MSRSPIARLTVTALALVSFALFSAPAHAGKKPKKGAEAPVTEAVAPEATPDVPAGALAFAKKLVKNPISGYRPGDAGGVDFKYSALTFAGDNTWTAVAAVSAAGETFDCNESGTWKADAGEGENAGTVEWTVTKSSCAGRPQEGTTRAQLRWDNGEWKVELR